MKYPLKTVMAVLLILVCITGLVFFIASMKDILPYPNQKPERTTKTTPAELSGSGKPCRSVEEWHSAAEKKGAWAGGILVNQSMTDSEIFSLLLPYNLTNPERIRIYSPHAFGYYILINASRNDSLPDTNLFFPDKTPGIGFSSPMHAFIEPARKEVNEETAVPVILYFGSDNEEIDLMNTIVRHNISLHKTRVVDLGDWEQSSVQADRVRRLQELNHNLDVLFAFREYLQEDIC